MITALYIFLGLIVWVLCAAATASLENYLDGEDPEGTVMIALFIWPLMLIVGAVSLIMNPPYRFCLWVSEWVNK